MQDERLEAVRMLEETAADFLALTEGIGDGLWTQTPNSGGWSLAEAAEHLALVEASCSKLLAKRLFTEKAGEESLLITRGRDAALAKWLEGTEARVAPDFVKPTGKWENRREVIQAFREHRRSNVASYQAAPAELRDYAFTHPILGPLDGFQWAIFLSQHLRRHLRQMQRIEAELTAN